MNTQKAVVPEGMLKVAYEYAQMENTPAHRDHYRAVLEAALGWLAAEVAKMHKDFKPRSAADLEPSFAYDQRHGYNRALADVAAMFMPKTNPIIDEIRGRLLGRTLTAGDAVELMELIQRCVKPE